MAWDLVDLCRSALTAEELSTAFVRLGVGEHGDAMVVALTPVAREGSPVLPEQMIQRLLHVQSSYHLDRELIELLAHVTRDRPAADAS